MHHAHDSVIEHLQFAESAVNAVDVDMRIVHALTSWMVFVLVPINHMAIVDLQLIDFQMKIRFCVVVIASSRFQLCEELCSVEFLVTFIFHDSSQNIFNVDVFKPQHIGVER